MRTEPPMSEPSASGTHPEATAAPLPPDEPPGVRETSCGFRVTPHNGLSVCSVWANSGVVVWPMMIAPARRKAVTTKASSTGIQSAKACEPRVVRWPATGVVSLTATGTPCSRPSGRRWATSRAARSAASIASSAQMDVKQLSAGCTADARSRAAPTASTGDSAPAAIDDASSCAAGAAWSTRSGTSPTVQSPAGPGA